MPRGFNSPEPAARIDAAVDAAAKSDQSSIPDLIRLLDSDDPATRLVAIGALERLTGKTHEYDFAASDADREAAVRRWQAWQQARSGAPSPDVAAREGTQRR